jgi:hypothetical protein
LHTFTPRRNGSPQCGHLKKGIFFSFFAGAELIAHPRKKPTAAEINIAPVQLAAISFPLVISKPVHG